LFLDCCCRHLIGGAAWAIKATVDLTPTSAAASAAAASASAASAAAAAAYSAICGSFMQASI
jgi:hypothetical protein